MLLRNALLILPILLLTHCTARYTVGMLSLGDLEGKTIPPELTGEVRSGESCGFGFHISDAVRDALDGTSYDTILDVTVASHTGVFVWSNCVSVEGQAISSKELK